MIMGPMIWQKGFLRAGALLVLVALFAAPSGAADWCPDAQQAPQAAVQMLLRDASRRLDDAPRPMPKVHTEGTLPGPAYTEASNARRDLRQMQVFALAWRLTRDRRYLDALAGFLDAWTRIYQISFNPIDETNFEGMIEAYALAADALPDATRTATAEFLRRMATGYHDRMARGRHEKRETWINNWQSHRVKIVTMISVALEDRALLARSREFYIEQLTNNIRADGLVFDFTQRDALHYVVYNLEPLSRAVSAARLMGEDWLRVQGRSGGSLTRALDWLVPYATGEVEHDEFVKSRVRFDAQRDAAGVKGFSGKWERRNARDLMWKAALLDGRYLPVAKSIAPAMPAHLATCFKAA